MTASDVISQTRYYHFTVQSDLSESQICLVYYCLSYNVELFSDVFN